MYESDAQATIEAMLDLSLSLDLAHPFPMGLAGPCDAQPSPTTPAWQFAAKPLEQAVSTQITWKNARTQSVRSLNKTGNYYCWNRTYDPGTGRWTTPDPATTPWSNLFDYVSIQPQSGSDPTGLADLKGWEPTGVNQADSGTGDGWWTFKWGYQVGATIHGNGARLYQRVSTLITFTCCCEEKSINLWNYFVEVFEPQRAEDTQASVGLRQVGEAKCKEAGGGALKKIQESRINRLFVAIAPPAVLRELKNSNTVFFDMTGGIDKKLKEAGKDSPGIANPPPAVAGVFEATKQTKLGDFVDESQTGKGSRADYAITYEANYKCNEKNCKEPSTYVNSSLKVVPSKILGKKMEYSAKDP